ncbi:MAG: peptide chain release factor N(5)-glutamine methyltransferase, partial [Burkholderiales bacterium]
MSGLAVFSTLTTEQALAIDSIDRSEAAYLLRAVTGKKLAQLIAHSDERLTAKQSRRFLALVKRRRKGEPVAYLIGRREFYGMDFEISPASMIPRPETELLVELALDRIAEDAPARILDLGAGSGAIGVSIAALRPMVEVLAVDRSSECLALAQRNAQRLLENEKRVSFRRSDWFKALDGERYELIVSNPPYIAEQDPYLEQGDLRFEPRAALAAGGDGLDAIRHIVAQAPHHLEKGGWLLFEHGYDQADAARSLLQGAGFSDLVTGKDLAGIVRVA